VRRGFSLKFYKTLTLSSFHYKKLLLALLEDHSQYMGQMVMDAIKGLGTNEDLLISTNANLFQFLNLERRFMHKDGQRIENSD
jgi:hypothetical protein